jgi:hypothetical protein
MLNQAIPKKDNLFPSITLPLVKFVSYVLHFKTSEYTFGTVVYPMSYLVINDMVYNCRKGKYKVPDEVVSRAV